MKTRTTVAWLAIGALAVGLTANAQQPPAPGTGNTGGGAPAAQRPHPPANPEQHAQRLMEKFDANKDSKLDVAELTQALEFLREHRREGRGGAGGVASNAVGRASSGEATGAPPRHAPPPAAQVAQQMIAKCAADGKGLTVAELAKALEERRENHEERKGGGPASGTPSPAPAN